MGHYQFVNRHSTPQQADTQACEPMKQPAGAIRTQSFEERALYDELHQSLPCNSGLITFARHLHAQEIRALYAVRQNLSLVHDLRMGVSIDTKL